MIDGFVDGLSGKSAPFFWLIAVILVCGVISNLIFVVRMGTEFFRSIRRLYRGGKKSVARQSIEEAFK